MKTANVTIKLLFAAAIIMLLNGCASSGSVRPYDNGESRAWNLTHSVGMNQLDDSKVPKDQISNMLLRSTYMAVDVGYFMTSPTLNMNFGNGLGLSLIGFLTDPKGYGERSTIIAWVPETEVASRAEANRWVNDAFRDATLNAMENLGIKGKVDFHNREKSPFFHETYHETQLSGLKADGNQCGAYYRTYPSNMSEATRMPGFVTPEGTGYRMWANDELEYPRATIYCYGDDLGPFVEFTSEISKNLPASLFIYTRLVRYDEENLPPMVHDHGKALFFVVAED